MLQRLPSYITTSRHGVFYFQIRIPVERQDLYTGRTLFRKSLRTKNRKSALYLAQRWWLRMMKSDFDYEKELGHEADLYSRGKEVDRQYRCIDSHDMHQLDEFVGSLSTYDKKALQHYGDVNACNGTSPTTIESNSPPCPSGGSHLDSIKLSVLIEKYIQEKKVNWQIHSSIKTEETVRNHLKLFVEVVSNILCDSLNRTHTVHFKDILLSFPKNKQKSKKYKHLSIEELSVMDIPQEDKISTATIKGYIDRITSFLEWGESNGYFEPGLDSPLKNAKKGLKSNKRANARRDVFSSSDLRKLFLSKQYLLRKHKKPTHYWVPLLAIFTGARLGEICSLSNDDVKYDDKGQFWYLDIHGNVKTDCSIRLIPIHHELIRLGFLDYVQPIHGRLFPELNKTKNGYGDTLSKWFNNTYLNSKNCNVGQEKSENKCFHSFRHTFLDTFKQQGLNLQVAEELAGHSPDGSQTQVTYTKSYKLETKNMELQKLKYENVDFSQIPIWAKAL